MTAKEAKDLSEKSIILQFDELLRGALRQIDMACKRGHYSCYLPQHEGLRFKLEELGYNVQPYNEHILPCYIISWDG